MAAITLIGVCVLSLTVTTTDARRPMVDWRADDDDEHSIEAESDGTELVAEHVNVVEGNVTEQSSVGQGVVVDGTPEVCQQGVYTLSATNCSTFLACNEGVETEGFCPPDFWFDPNYKGDMLCNHPEIVCATDNTVCDCAAQYPPLAPDPLIEQDVTCLADNRFHFSSSRLDCGRYFVCFNGHVRRMECKSGFQFDPKTESCDYPELVNCKVYIFYTPFFSPFYSLIWFLSQIIDPDCPVNGVGFLAHPSRSDAFYFCFYGYKTIQSCSFFHVWDPASNSCRRRDDMNMI